MGRASTVPPLFPRFGSTQPPRRKDGPTNGPPRPPFSPRPLPAMFRASDLSYLYSSQPSSSQNPCDEEAVERVFWQSTPTILEELRQGKDDKCHQAPLGVRDRPGDPLSLSTGQSKLIPQTGTSDARPPGGETRTSSRHEYRRKRGRAAGPDSTDTSANLSPDKPIFFGHLKNIEKVCNTVDERMQKRKVQKEWSTRMISETARLRDEADIENTNMHGERPLCDDNVDVVEVDASDVDHPGTPQSESVEEVPTSQSQERYLSVFHLSQTGFLGGPCAAAPIHGNYVGVALTSVKSPAGPVTTDILSEDPGALVPGL